MNDKLTFADILLMAPGGFAPMSHCETHALRSIKEIDTETCGGYVQTGDNVYWVTESPGHETIADLQMILRPLESMTEEERAASGIHFGMDAARGTICYYTTKQFKWLLMHNFDVYGMIASGKAIPEQEENHE